VPYQSLKNALKHIEQKIKTNSSIAMHRISDDVRQIHMHAIIHYVHVENHIIVFLLILFTANTLNSTCTFYRVVRHQVTVPNSQVSTILNTQSHVEYIAIGKNSMQLTKNSTQNDNL